jgi:hypothetical protein
MTDFDPTVVVAAHPHATKRTKNRLREHGPLFRITERRISLSIFPEKEIVELHSLKTGWIGWVPEAEIVYGLDEATEGR